MFETNREFRDKLDEPVYPREMLLRLVLMGVFDGELSLREIEWRTRNDIAYICTWQVCKNRLQNNFKI